jgi:hypothetical protein
VSDSFLKRTNFQRSSPEFSFLVHVLASAIRDTSPTPPSATIRWDVFLALSSLHGVIPHVAAALSGSKVHFIPENARAQLADMHRATAAASMSQVSEYLAIHKRFSDAGILDVPLKGAVLSQALFGSIGARQSSDIDIWVAPEDHDRADAMLRASGYARERPAVGFRPLQLEAYRRGNNEFNYRTAGGLLIDLHWRLHPFNRLAPLDIRGVVADGVTIKVGGTKLPWFSDESLYLYLLTHAAREKWYQLKWVVDALTLYRRNPKALGRFAQSAGVTRIHQQLMLLADGLLGMDEMTRGLAIDPIAYRLRNDALQAMPSRERRPSLLWWVAYFLGRPAYYARLRDDPEYRREVWRTEYFTPHYGEICSLPDRALPLFWLFRPFIFFSRYGRRAA